MSRRIVSMVTVTPTATADGSNLTDNTYAFVIQGASATQTNRIWEISISGQAASSSSPTFMILSRDSQLATGTASFASGGVDANFDPATAAIASPVVTANQFGTNKPQRSSTGHLINASLNAFGGVYFWRANRVEECPLMLGNTASVAPVFGQISLSAFTGGTTGAIGAHAIYETQ